MTKVTERSEGSPPAYTLGVHPRAVHLVLKILESVGDFDNRPGRMYAKDVKEVDEKRKNKVANLVGWYPYRSIPTKLDPTLHLIAHGVRRFMGEVAAKKIAIYILTDGE